MAEPRRPRICVLTSVHPPFDTRVFHRQAKAARDFGYEVTLVAPGAPRGMFEGIQFKGLPTWGGRAGRPLRWPVLVYKALRARADLYHFHDPELLPWGLLLKWLSRRPVVYDSHEYLREDILGKHWIPAPLRPLVAAMADRMEKFVARRLSAVVAVTEDMADRFRRAQPRTITVQNLPPTGLLPNPLPMREPVIIHAGLMNVERGLGIVAEVARLVRLRHPQAEICLLGPVEWQGLPRGSEAGRRSWEGVRFEESIPQPEVAAKLAAASIGWLPRDPEVRNNHLAWPTKLVEYMMVGLPVVASDLPTQAAVVREADCGLLAEGLSAQSHAEAICALLDDPARARKLGQNGREVAIERFTWEAQAARLHSLYKSLLAGT